MDAVTLEAKLLNNKKFMAMFEKFPAAMKRGYVRFLYSTRKSFLGTNTGYDGLFRRRAQQLRRGKGATGIFGGRTGEWPKNMVNAWKGIVKQYAMDSATLFMGTGYKKEKPFMQGLYGMEMSTPQMTVTSSENMVMPAYRNLIKKGISTSPMHKWGRNMSMKEANKRRMFAKQFGDKTIMFDADDTYKSGAKKGQFKPSAIMFILKKKFKMPTRIDFFRLWGTQNSKTLKRLNNVLRQTIRGIEKGYVPV